MKARKGESDFWGGVLVAALVGLLVLVMTLDIVRRMEISRGYFEHKQKVYKVTEYSKLEYPEKGTE